MNIRMSIYLIHQYQILKIKGMCCINSIISISIRVNTLLQSRISISSIIRFSSDLRVHISIRISTIISINIGISTFLVLVVGWYSK